MGFCDRVLDLSLRKVIRRGRAFFGLGDPWVKPLIGINQLIGDEQAARIALMPRYTVGEAQFNDLNLVFNDSDSFLGMLDEIFIRQNYLFSTKNDRPLIIDCGANIGVGVAYFKTLYPNAVIYAFEPDESAFDCLSENVKRNNFTNVHLYKNAVWVNNNELEFFSDGSWGGGVFPKDGATKVKVKAVDISDFLDQPVDFLKMDIEGAESRVIEHASTKILTNAERFFFEWHSMKATSQQLGSILSKFESSGFRYHIKEASGRRSPFDYIPEGVMDSQLDVFLYKV